MRRRRIWDGYLAAAQLKGLLVAADLPEAMLNNNSPTTLNLAGHGNCLGDGQEQEEVEEEKRKPRLLYRSTDYNI